MKAYNKWPLVPLGEILTQYCDYIDRPEPRQYPKLSVKLYGKGVVLDAPADGSLLKMRRHQVAKAGQVILSEIWGKKGAIGFVPEEGDGALCTSHFFLFDVKRDQVEPGWLRSIFKANYLQIELNSQAFGTTGYAAVRPKALLSAAIPLPPLEEQRRIVSRVDSLVAKIEEAKTLRKQSTSQLNAVAVSLAHRGDLTDDEKLRMGWKAIRLGGFIRTEYDDHKVQTCEEYPNLGIYSYGRGLFVKPPISGMATSAAKLRKVHSGQFIYSRLFAWEGAFGLVTPEFDGWYVSSEYPTFACDQDHILPEFLFAYFKTEQAWKKVAIGSKGLGSRRQRVQPEQILNHCLLLPPMDIQEKIKRTLESAAKGRIQILEAEASIDVLLPSILDRAFQGGL